MFTGIIQTTGQITQLTDQVITVKVPSMVAELKMGSSIAVDGACLTVTSLTDDSFAADFMPETAQRTIIGKRRVGDLVNLELPMAANGRFEGHIVSGHVDAVGEFLGAEANGNARVMSVSFPPEYNKYVVGKGSITLNGISLTVNAVGDGQLTVSIIPHTWAETNLHLLKRGDRVNVEFDLLAKHLEKLIVKN